MPKLIYEDWLSKQQSMIKVFILSWDKRAYATNYMYMSVGPLSGDRARILQRQNE